MKAFLTALLLFTALPAPAQDYEQFLLPVVLFDELRGGYSSVWTNELILRNISPEDVAFRPHSCGELSGDCPPSGQLRPYETLAQPPIWYDSGGSWAPHGLFLYLEKPVSRVALSLHLRELGRSAGWGTRLPIVRADDAFTRGIEILNVPTESQYRHTLRIYSFDSLAPIPFRIKVFDLGANQVPDSSNLLHEFVIDASGVVNHHEGGYALLPGYAQVDLNVQDIPAVAAAQRLRVTVEPLLPSRFWTYLSVTDNATQQVTLFAPEN